MDLLEAGLVGGAGRGAGADGDARGLRAHDRAAVVAEVGHGVEDDPLDDFAAGVEPRTRYCRCRRQRGLCCPPTLAAATLKKPAVHISDTLFSPLARAMSPRPPVLAGRAAVESRSGVAEAGIGIGVTHAHTDTADVDGGPGRGRGGGRAQPDQGGKGGSSDRWSKPECGLLHWGVLSSGLLAASLLTCEV